MGRRRARRRVRGLLRIGAASLSACGLVGGIRRRGRRPPAAWSRFRAVRIFLCVLPGPCGPNSGTTGRHPATPRAPTGSVARAAASSDVQVWLGQLPRAVGAEGSGPEVWLALRVIPRPRRACPPGPCRLSRDPVQLEECQSSWCVRPHRLTGFEPRQPHLSEEAGKATQI